MTAATIDYTPEQVKTAKWVLRHHDNDADFARVAGELIDARTHAVDARELETVVAEARTMTAFAGWSDDAILAEVGQALELSRN